MADDPRREPAASRDDSGQMPAAPKSPSGWWRLGLVVLAVLVVVLALMQLWQRAPGTDVQPGTPTIAPDVPPPVLPTT